MTYEQFINQALDIRQKIDHKIERVERLEEICNKASAPLSERVQTSTVNSRDISLTKLADERNELEKLYSKLWNVEDMISTFLFRNLSRTDADILIYKYVDGKSVQEIADKKKMADGSVRNRMSKADKIAEKMYYKTRGMKKV